jgi:NAD(P)-dependent dehydrogenase (short-subunit alcohol dehydrogenase family)
MSYNCGTVKEAYIMQKILITGSTDGIGLQAAIDIAKKRHHVIVHGRTAEKAKMTAEKIKKAADNQNVDSIAGDFSSLAQVRKMAEEIKMKFPKLDVLLNNAGIYMEYRQETQCGHEMTFQVNYLAPTLLTLLILDTLKQDKETRIVNVASIAHQSAHLDLDDLENKKFDAYTAYANSKLENILFTYSLAKQLQGTKVMVNALHPGVIQTKLLQVGFGGGGAPISQGAKALEYVATSEDLKGITGSYFNRLNKERSSPVTYDETFAKKLWDKTMPLIWL